LSERKAICDICGERKAAFVCSRCGRKVCHNCFDAASWLCSECLSQLEGAGRPIRPMPAWPFALAAVLFVVGVVLVAVGTFMLGPRATVLLWPPFIYITTVSTAAFVLALVAMVLFVIAVVLLFYAIVRYLLLALWP